MLGDPRQYILKPGERLNLTGRRWYVDETYVKVKGKWSYLYRAMDREGNLVDSLLSATRDMNAAQRLFRGALSVINQAPIQVTTDGTIRTRVRSEKLSAPKPTIAAMLI